jgi:hypothetical protein
MELAEPMLLAEPPLAGSVHSGRELRAIGTLGPAGTSSEEAARHVWPLLGSGVPGAAAGAPVIRLYESYEAAAESLGAGVVSHLLVANAYAGVNAFYMDAGLDLLGAFIRDTPRYGLAKARGRQVPVDPTVATHPAPLPLIAQLLPEPYRATDIVLTTSTSAAARAAEDGSADLALTTAPAAAAHHLDFISPTRVIRMLWSVFVLRRGRSTTHG